MCDAQDDNETVPTPEEWREKLELTPRHGTWDNRGTTNDEFIEMFLGHARKPFREVVSVALGISAEELEERITESVGGWKSETEALPFGLLATWDPSSDESVQKRWKRERQRAGSLHHLAGVLDEIEDDDELCPVRGTMTAGSPRRIVRDQLLVLDRPGNVRAAPRDGVDGGIREAIMDLLDNTGDQREISPGGLTSIVPDDIMVESVALDQAVLRRVTIPFDLPSGEKTAETREEALEYLATALGADVPAARVADSLSHTAFQPGSITFQPGSITFQPGSITFQPGSITFQPAGAAARVNLGDEGRLTYSPAAVLPRPTMVPAEVLARVSDARWRQATSMSGPSRPVSIAVLDTGIDQASMEQHPLLVGQSTTSRELTSDFEIPPVEPMPATYGHGTFIAGLIAQRAPFARINHETVRNVGGVTDAFEIAVDLNDVMDADIICLSFGIAARNEADVVMLHEAVKYLHAKGKVIVAAAGSITDVVDEHGKYDPAVRFYPAAFEEVLGVGTADRDGKPAPFSPVQDWVNVWSYGVNVMSAFPVGNVRWSPTSPLLRFDGWASWSGSSMAAPRVAAAIADAAARSGRTPSDIVREIRINSDEMLVLQRPVIA